ncbi:hypothetical protein FB451DRAFT_1181871 [Mycena latifolia]|nr:hypothetical protein FB451DRAFT_1181871 [Mycena latifolia]
MAIPRYSKLLSWASQRPRRYSFAYVPRNAKVVVSLIDGAEPVLSSSYSIPKAAVGVIQAVYTLFTFYRSNGPQIGYYGYTAFGLTVLPYAFMTFVNVIGNFLTLDYATLHLVQSDLLQEAQRHPGATFYGVVGKSVAADESKRVMSLPDDVWSGTFEVQEEPEVGRTKLLPIVFAYHRGRPPGLKLKTSSWLTGKRSTKKALIPRRPHLRPSTIAPGVEHQDIELVDGQPVHANGPDSPTYTPASLTIVPADDQPLSAEEAPRLYLQIPACSRFERHDYNPFDSCAEYSFPRRTHPGFLFVLLFVCSAIGGVLALFLGCLSGWFNSGHNTSSQRTRILAWLIVGSVVGFLYAILPYMPRLYPYVSLPEGKEPKGLVPDLSLNIRAWIVIFVGKMLRESGNRIKS